MNDNITIAKSVTITPANYIPSNLATCRGNPLIEALPPRLGDVQIWDQLYWMPTVTPEELQQLTPEERALRIDELLDAHIPSPTTYTLYDRMRRVLIEGYQMRNPIAVATRQSLFELNSPTPRTRPWNRTSVRSLLYMAPSGKGKSTVVRNILQLFPEVIEHKSYLGHTFYLKQPLFLMVDCPSNGSKKTLIERILTELDRSLGTTSAEDCRRKHLNISSMQTKLGELCAQHFVGMIIIDELHNLRVPNDKSSSTNADLATLAFVDELFNSIGIPVLLIGTWRCSRLLTKTMETGRRAGNQGRISENPFELDDEYWTQFIDTLWGYQLCHAPSELNASIQKEIHFASGGLPALAVQLLVAAQQLAIESGDEKVSLRILKHVYETEFLPLHNALHQLRSKEYAGYEDLIRPQDELAGFDRSKSA